MADPTPPTPADSAADPTVEPARVGRLPRISLAWLVPLIALAISLGVAWRSYSDRGPVVEILFDSATGIIPGETTVRYRDFTIGLVERVGFTEGLDQVVVHARVQREMARFIDENSTFWLVRAQVGPGGISGLDTVLTGAYIEASFDNFEGPPERRFTALPRPPLTPAGQPGMRVTLQSTTGGSLAVGAPVLFKQIAVGTIESVELTEEGEVTVSAFIDAPHHERLNRATRFWNASGFTVELGTAGASLRVDSLASLVRGGIAFDTVAAGGGALTGEPEFQLYASENDARNSVLTGADWATPVRLATVFDGSVRGLRVGADVEYNGVRVGEVTGVQARISESPDGPRVQLYVTLDVLPNRFGVPESDDAEEQVFDLIEAAISRGLRAQLAAQGLLGTTLYVNLVEMPALPAGSFDRAETPIPTVPSAPVETGDMMTSATGLVQRLAALPLEDVVRSATTLLDNASALIADDAVRQAPAELGLLLADIRTLVGSDEVQQAPAELAALLASLRVVTDDLARQEVAASLAETLTTATRALDSVGTAAEGVPDALDAVTGQIRDLPLEATVEELRRLLAELREGGAVANANATLAAIRQVADDLAAARLAETLTTTLGAIEAAVGNVDAATAGVPELLASLTALSDEARALPLEELVASASRVLATADAFIASEAIAEVPQSVNTALTELRLMLAGLRTGGAVDNLNASLASIRALTDELAAARLAESLTNTLTAAENAAASVDTATAGLPELVDNLTALSQEARDLPLEELVTSGRQVLDTADRLIGSEGMAEVPPQLAAALAELRLTLVELREGGAVENLNTTLASADEAAAAVAAAAQSLPALVAQLSATASRADQALGSFGPGSDINRDTLLLLRELRDAARSVNSLVTALERRPNSVLFGR